MVMKVAGQMVNVVEMVNVLMTPTPTANATMAITAGFVNLIIVVIWIILVLAMVNVSI